MYHLQVLTPEKVVFDGDAIDLIAPGTDGNLGILKNHAPLITTLRPGMLQITDKDKKVTRYMISEGFLEVKNNVVSVLIEKVEQGCL